MTTSNAVRRIAAIASLAIAVTACSTAPTPQAQAWSGTSTSGETAHPLQVDVAVLGADWTGTYTIGTTPPFTGDVTAELADGVLTGELIATSACTFALTGTVTDDALEATFTPAGCPGGEAGTWSATPTDGDR
jgi:hypothetical protein